MKITLDTATLTAALFKLQGIVNSKSTLPILSNALLEADEEGVLRLYATDLDISVATTVNADVQKPGRITIRAKDLYDAVKNLRSQTVTLEKEDNLWVQMTAGTVKARFVGMDPAEFPQTQSTEGVEFFGVPSGKFVRMIDRSLFSISTDDGRPNLTGALLRVDGEQLLMVATDGHRLSMIRINVDVAEAPSRLKDESDVIIPRKGLSELRRTVDLTNETLQVGISGSNAVFRQGETTHFVRLIDGTFPVFSGALPDEKEERQALVDRDELVGRVKFVSLFSNSKTHNVTLQLEDGTCTISSQDPDKGECLEKIPVNYTGPSVKAGYNYRYLLDVLNVADTEQMSLEIIDTISPTVLHEVAGDQDESSLFIVMPMRL